MIRAADEDRGVERHVRVGVAPEIDVIRRLKPGRAGTMTHDYKRHGTTTLFAALNILDGTICAASFAPSSICRLPSTGSSQRPTPTQNPSSGLAIPNACSQLSSEGRKR
jgi:hypothetical protein